MFCSAVISAKNKELQNKSCQYGDHCGQDHRHHGYRNTKAEISGKDNQDIDHATGNDSDPPCIIKRPCSQKVHKQDHYHKRDHRDPHCPVMDKSVRDQLQFFCDLCGRITECRRLCMYKPYKIIDHNTASGWKR